jgi:GDP/UDP-N,N'-diacetylbacillosamine 2-epimerase (hydrolysing)
VHPVTEEAANAKKQARMIIEALNLFDLPKVIIMPNNDTGSEDIRNAIFNYREGKYYTFANLKRQDYLGLLRNCVCMVGNSSSGLLEAPTFKIPAINVGRRQHGRCRGENVIDVDFELADIINAIHEACSESFRAHLNKHCTNPYGDGRSSELILNILQTTKIDEKLLVKELTY